MDNTPMRGDGSSSHLPYSAFLFVCLVSLHLSIWSVGLSCYVENIFLTKHFYKKLNGLINLSDKYLTMAFFTSNQINVTTKQVTQLCCVWPPAGCASRNLENFVRMEGSNSNSLHNLFSFPFWKWIGVLTHTSGLILVPMTTCSITKLQYSVLSNNI